jgi:hypothetical protein
MLQLLSLIQDFEASNKNILVRFVLNDTELSKYPKNVKIKISILNFKGDYSPSVV